MRNVYIGNLKYNFNYCAKILQHKNEIKTDITVNRSKRKMQIESLYDSSL